VVRPTSLNTAAFLEGYWHTVRSGADAFSPILAVGHLSHDDAKESKMVRTYGLTHINLVVRDVERSLRFYGQVFGVEEYGRTEGLVHTRTPGCQDVITFDEQASGAGESRGIAHFGFRLVSPGDIDAAVDEVEHAGGKLLRRGEFSPDRSRHDDGGGRCGKPRLRGFPRTGGRVRASMGSAASTISPR
jgi:catechol 2,3-dioxygenase-like lactoylglutathione lyase family enzyme